MKFKLDENLPFELVTDLQGMGHDADTVVDEGLGGADDPTVVDAAFASDRILLLTLDKVSRISGAIPFTSTRELFCFDLTLRDEGPLLRSSASGCTKYSKWTLPTD